MLAETVMEWSQQWEQQGLSQGLSQGRTIVLERLLTRRFGQLPNDICLCLHNATVDQLDHWADTLLEAETLEDVFRHHCPCYR